MASTAKSSDQNDNDTTRTILSNEYTGPQKHLLQGEGGVLEENTGQLRRKRWHS